MTEIASEKLELTHLVEGSSLSVRRTAPPWNRSRRRPSPTQTRCGGGVCATCRRPLGRS